jgi:hypothetical protein
MGLALMTIQNCLAVVCAIGLVLADAALASLAVLAVGGSATIAWYVVIEGSPSLTAIGAAWRTDAPIPLGLVLGPVLTVLLACIAGVVRLIDASWMALLGGWSLRWVPRLQRLARGRSA